MLFLAPCAGGIGLGQEDQEKSQERAPGLGPPRPGDQQAEGNPPPWERGRAGCALGTRSVSSWSCESTSILPIRLLFGCP